MEIHDSNALSYKAILFHLVVGNMRKVNVENIEYEQCEVCVHYKLVKNIGFKCEALPRRVYLRYKDEICPLFKLNPRRVKLLRRIRKV